MRCNQCNKNFDQNQMVGIICLECKNFNNQKSLENIKSCINKHIKNSINSDYCLEQVKVILGIIKE